MVGDLGTRGPVGDGCGGLAEGTAFPKIQMLSPPQLRLLTGRAWLSVSSWLEEAPGRVWGLPV